MDISSATWTTLSKLLDEALDLEPVARVTWLERLNATRPEIAPAVRELLAAHASSETADVFARLPSIDIELEAAARRGGLAAGDRVGPYRLKREIGSGGMADVWLAERADGAFTREVALKLPRVSLLRRDLAARFSRERDILARLEHPHIARLYDAGVTADGLPYLAMEYVDGQPINAYCDQQRLDISARLRLFAQVLDAVQYAHANLVVHRDLKPSNILMTNDGQARLLDFGIAKLLEGETARETQLTQLGGRALTPDYASPEQIKGEPLTIAADVYSLGVVLYELLAGQRPYKLQFDSVGQLELAIISADPARPSTTPTVGAALLRNATPQRLTRALSGDLDTIVLKALAKAPAERYLTIAEFAQDLQRHLAGQPVSARPASWGYRAKKFVVRNRLAVGAAAAIGVALITAVVVSLWQARVAQEQATAARREAKRAEAVQTFLLDIFRANSDRQKDPIKARSTTARELLDLGTERVDSALANEPEAHAEVLKTLAEMYYQLQLEEQSAGIDSRRVELLRKLHGSGDRRVAEALVALAASLHATPRRAEILPTLDEARRILDAQGDHTSRLRGELLTRLAQRHQNVSLEKMREYADQAVSVLRPHAVDHDDRLSTALHLAARARTQLGDYADGERLYRESIAELGKNVPVSQVALQQNLYFLAESQAAQQKLDEAVQTYRQAIDGARHHLGENDPGTMVLESRLAALLHAMGQRDEARRLHEDALRRVIAIKGDADTLFTPIVRIDFGRSMLAEGRLREANDLVGRVNASNRRHYPGSAVLGAGLRTQAVIATAFGRYDEASRLFAEAGESWRKGAGSGLHPSRNNRFGLDQASLELAQGSFKDAIDRLQRVVPPPNADHLRLRAEEIERDILLAQGHLRLGDAPRASTLAATAQQQIAASPLRQYYPALEAQALLRLGQAQQIAGDSTAARANFERALELRTALDHPASPWLSEVQIALADCLIRLGDSSKARDFLAAVKSAHAANPELGEHFRQPLRAAMQRLSAPANPRR